MEKDLVSPGDLFEAKTASLNYTYINLEDLKMDSNFAWLLCSLVSAMAWVIYITHYDSRVIGFIITRLLNRFVAHRGYMKVGSFTWSALAGKIMFRDVVYITNDYSVRVQDGWLIFRWWRAYVPKDVSEDLSHSDTRLSLMLNGFELHTYNRSNLYARLEKLFGLDSQLYTPDDPGGPSDANEDGERSGCSSVERAVAASGADLSRSWRDLIPVIKIDVSSGRIVFGNRLVPTTLSINVEEAHFVYSTKPAASRLDHFMHFVKCKAENFKVILAPSPKYTGMVDDPPRYMGEGFVVLSSNNVELYYYMDEPGLVPEEPEMLQLANGDIVESAPPIWGMDIKCGKGTDFSYGPWADRQREHLFKFFFPNDCQPLKVTKAPQPGEKRLVQSFDIRLSTLNEATIDILFSKNKETNAVHVNVGPGSYLEVTMPWIVQQDGYTTKITGQLLHLEATTSLQYRSLVESETLEFTVKCHYPIKWNDHQEWVMNFTGCKATANIIYAHKAFFQDMVNDWASKARPDILHFVPYTWKLSFLLKEFEVISVCNEYNWIDCSSQNQENAHIAFCGDLFDLSFDLPFVDFLPPTIPLRFWIQGESVDLALYLPEVFSSRSVLLALDKNAKILGKDLGKPGKQRLETAHKWRNVCQKSAGWVDCWSVQIVALSINYTYHPTPPLGPPPQADITTPEKEEILLSPMRFPRAPRKSPLQWAAQHVQDGAQSFDPTSLPPDKVSLELELSPSVLIVYGSWLRNFMHLKENIFGDDQTFTDMQQSHSAAAASSSGGSVGIGGRLSDDDDDDLGKQTPFDPRLYRPLEVSVSVTLHDVQAHLVKNCGENDPACPVILIERFGFEMKKGYRETKLQLLLSPATLLSCDHLASRPAKDSHLDQGHLMLSGLQVRGHAMFSDEGRSLDEETLEYAWLLELQLGKLNGKLTTPQLYHLVTSLETFALLLTDSENTLRSPYLVPVTQKPGVNTKLNKPPPSAHGFEQTTTNPSSGGSPSNRGSILGPGMLSSEKGSSGLGSETQRTSKTEVSSTTTVPNPNLLHPPVTMHSLSSSSCASSSLGCGNGENPGMNRTQPSLQRGDSDKNCVGDIEQGVKYRMVRVAIDALDLYLVESGTALQIWASPIRIATCNLHSRNIKSGVTGMIPMIQVRQFISTGGGFGNVGGGGTGSASGGNAPVGQGAQNSNRGPPHLNRANSDCGAVPSQSASHPLNSDMWLEVGIVTLGPLIVEAATSPPQLQEASYQSQQKYLRLHDEKMKRLWFLWDGKVGGSGSRFASKDGRSKKCGCTGGCAFFGMNRNGPKFFTPSRHDVQEGINIAAFRIHGPSKDPGFGQSILHEGQLVFHTPPYGSQDVSLQEPSRWDISTQAQEPSPRKSNKESSKKKIGDSVANIEKEVPVREGMATPSPLSQSRADKQHLARRFSCTSAGGGVSGTGGNTAAKDVPYSRLLDSPALPPKLDSDSRLDVPETTIVEVPKSSCSDSKLSVDYFGIAGVHGASKEVSIPPPTTVTACPSQHSTPQPTVTTPPQQQRVRETKGSNVNTSDSHHSLTAAEIEAEISQKVQRTVSMSSENHSEAFFSADEDPNVMATGGGLSSSTVSGIVTWPVGRSVGTSERKFPSEMSIAVVTDSASSADRNGKQPHLPSHPRLSSHCSDHEIHTPEHRAHKSDNTLKAPVNGMMEGGDGRLRVSESASPIPLASPILLKPDATLDDMEINVNGGPEMGPQEVMSIYARPESGLDSSSDTQSVSSTSFISAVSSQEDMTLVNLHMQVNKPIIDSPLLMSCYVNHLSQVRCTNWAQCSLPAGCDAFTVPLFERCENGKLHYIGGRKVPHFDTATEGFTSLKMVGRRKGELSHGSEGGPSPPAPPSGHSKSPTGPYAWDTMTFLPAEPDAEPEADYDDELLTQSSDGGTKISIIVKLKGDMDIMVCPLVLESLQRFVDALTPMMATLHPLTVLNRLHCGCISRVEAANVLKKEQSAYLSQLQQVNSRGGTAERIKEASSKNSKMDGIKSQALLPGVYEESISTQTQGTIMLPKVNITLLQTSVVEEIISFSALDNLRDLTCVSLFAVCFNDLTAQFFVSKQAREVVHTFHRPAPVLRRSGGGGGIFPSYGSGGNVGWGANAARTGGGVGLGDSQQKKLAAKVIGRGGSATDTRGPATGNGDWGCQGEAVHIETSEKQQEEVVVSLSISHIHSQLRRLRNESSILKQAVVTAIPAQHSRVLFTCTRIPSPLKIERPERTSSLDTPNSVGRHVHREGSFKGMDNLPSSFSAASNTAGEDRLGFIMFECGFEGVSLKVVKRSQFVRGGSGGSQWSDDLESILGIDAGGGQDNKVHKQKESGRSATEPDTAGKSDGVEGEGVGEGGIAVKNDPGGGNASSCVMEFRTVWFNFAAPPRAPITRKLDYTRLDWNLLSTASPAINAWLNPSNRFAIRTVHMLRTKYRRSTGIVACLMAEALDVQGINMPPKSRYGRVTPLAKTLQEDPSCQLCNVLQKYVLQSDLPTIESNLKDGELPLLSTLRQGVIVLSRQWKNVLYTPLLLEHNYKSSGHLKPLNVAIRIPPTMDEEYLLTDGELSGEECEVTDECTMLLNAEGGSMHRLKNQDKLGRPEEPIPSPNIVGQHTSEYLFHQPLNTTTSPPANPRTMHIPPNMNAPPMGQRRRRRHRRKVPKKEKSVQQQKSADEVLINVRDASNFKSPICSPKLGEGPEGLTTGSSSSGAHDNEDATYGDEEGEGDDDSLDGGESGAHFPSPLARNVSGTENEDLYTWMSKQQEFMKPNPTRVAAAAEEERQKMKGNWDSKINTMTTEETVEDAGMMHNGPSNIPIANYSSSLHLLDAHLIFEPLLTCLGVMPGQISAGSVGAASEGVIKEGMTGYSTSSGTPFENWGSNISIAGSMETMRIDIVVSECGKGIAGPEKRKSGPSKTNGEFSKKGHGKFRLDIPSEMPAFLCEKIGVELDLRKLADTSVDDLVQKHNVLYISRGQLRKHTSTLLNFSVDIRYISQQVNMPLLRLLHQISNMYQNVKETQMELRGQQQQVHSLLPHPPPPPQLSGIIDPKNGSSSVSDLQEHAALYEDGPMDSVKMATLTPTLGLSNSTSIPKGLSPSSSLKSRPQSFAQKFRSTSKSVKAGYMNLSEAITTPTFGSSPTASRMEIHPMPTQHLHHSLPHPHHLQHHHPLHHPLPSPVPPASLSSLGLSHDDMSIHAAITAEPPIMSEQPILKMPEPTIVPPTITAQVSGSPQAQPPPMAPPHCWKTIYYLLDLYATMPETKTITHRFSMAPVDISEGYKGNRKYDILTEVKSSEDVEKGIVDGGVSVAADTSSRGHTPQLSETRHHQLGALVGSGMRERTRLVVFGVARIQRTRLLATLSGLKLEAEISSLQASITCRRKSRPASLECSLAGQVGRTMIVLLEGVAPNQQTVVKVTVGKSQALYSSLSRRYKDKNSGLLTVGPVCVDIPQHPVALHGMMTRGSKQLSSTLQELRVTRSSSRISRGGTISEETMGATTMPDLGTAPAPTVPSASAAVAFTSPHHFPQHTVSSLLATPSMREREVEPETSHLLQPLVMQFSIILQSLRITAALLPSLQAQYKMDQVNSTGVTGSKAKFTIDLPQHSLSFTTKLQVTEANLPSAASIELPKVHVMAEYVQDGSNPPEAQFADGVILRQGSYLSAVAEIGVFEHSLTTDLLNHLVFVQKVFMKEVNEVVQKVYGGEKPVPIWLEGQEDSSASSLKRLLFSLVIRIKRIQLTATTPTNSAVRLETGAVEFQLSNRVQNVSTVPPSSTHSHCRPRPQKTTSSGDDGVSGMGNVKPQPTTNGSGPATMKIFGKAQVDVNLSLGQLIKNVMFEEAEPEFQQFAFFKTRIGLRNAFQDEMVQRGVGTSSDNEDDKEVVLITLRRPLIYIQPLAVDKAILVWLNYRNAYEYWNEQRSCLNKEVLTATQQVFEKVPFGQLTSQLSSPHMGTLFLQLTVDDMGICLPLNPLPSAYNMGHRKGGHPQQSGMDSGMGGESRGAVVVTLESTSISACSSGSLVSKGRFVGLCLRFADDFETSLDDWKPDAADSSLTNLCVVSEGTYEVCSRTIAQKQGGENAKWILNVQWQMEGVDIHLDVNVGKQLSALGHTLTTLTGAEEEEEEEGLMQPGGGIGTVPTDYDDSDDADRVDGTRASQESIGLRRTRHLPGDNLLQTFARNPSLDARQRSKLIEKEMNEQAKIINDLRSLGASHGTIEQEMRRLHELEAMVFKDFRRDMIQKLRRQSVRASSIKGKFGLGGSASGGVIGSGSGALGLGKKLSGIAIPNRPGTFRSLSFVGSSSPDHQHEMESSPDDAGNILLAGGYTGSFESSPHSGPSRSTSLRVKGLGPRVTFSECHNVCSTPSPSRQSSLISGGDSELSLGDIELGEGWQQAQHKQFIQDTLIHPPLEQTAWEEDSNKVEMRRTQYSQSRTDYSDLTDGSVPLLSPYSSRDRMPVLSPGVTPGGGSSSPFTQKTQEPNIDFELDVKVLINSGKCVLHTKDPSKEDELKVKMKKERSVSGGIFDFPSSPNMSRRGLGGGGSGKQETGSSKQVGISMSGVGVGGGTNRLRFLHAGTGVGGGGSSTSSSAAVAHLVDITIFHIPGLDVKVHYESKTLHEDIPMAPSPRLGPDMPAQGSRGEGPSNIPQQHSSGRTKGGGIKKASLFAWMTLQSIPEETIISPHILEFLEQTLEPIPSPSVNQPAPSHGKSSTSAGGTGPGATIFSMDLDGTTVGGGGTGGISRTGSSSVYGGSGSFPSAASSSSFPVDVIVYFHMQPSTFRFSCLPVSRVECMLQLPSLDIVFSSKRAEEEELYGDHAEIGPTKLAQPGRPSLAESGAFPPSSSAIGGLSVTGCLADFSVYIFHPYGGGKKSGLKEAQWSPLADSERKDSLSVNVEFVKFHLSRSRKLNFGQHQQFEHIKGFKGSLPADKSQAVIRFSTIVDIGSASFKYDMRRLTEILAFPKAWYRRSIVRRLFLGDLSMGAAFSEGEEEVDGVNAAEEEDSTSPSSSENKDGLGVPYQPQAQQARSFAGHESSNFTDDPVLRHSVPLDRSSAVLAGTRDRLRLSLESDAPSTSVSRNSSTSSAPSQRGKGAPARSSWSAPDYKDGRGGTTSPPTHQRSLGLFQGRQRRVGLGEYREGADSGHESKGEPSSTSAASPAAWETLVLFAVNFTKLNVHMNMGNVMGNVMWLTKDFHSEGRLSIGSNGHKNVFIGMGLGGSSLDAKGGIVGGTIELSRIDTFVHIREDPGIEPDHTVGLKLFAVELRLDYMGTGVLMSRVSSLDVSLRDEWKLHHGRRPSDAFVPTKRPAMIFMHGDMGWDQLQLMISKSTTADLLKMFYKLEEFFSQQFKSSKRVFSSLQPWPQQRPSFKKKVPLKRKVTSSNLTGGASVAGMPSATSTTDAPNSIGASSALQDARHHRHWQRVLREVGGLCLPTLALPLPHSGTVLGGTMELHGNNISLACFHGINFKSKSWALFSLKEPCISFATEAQEIPSSHDGDIHTENPNLLQDVHVVQTLTFSLGMTMGNEQPQAQHHSMATVCRMSRNVLFPPQFRTLQEWFHYAFAGSEIDAVDRFPSLEREKYEGSTGSGGSSGSGIAASHNASASSSHSPPSMGVSSSSSERRSTIKLQDPNHTREVIFALPSLQLHLKTEHLQTARTPDVADLKPVVECSFITEFEDHIFVTVDAEAFFFLHDLITSYVREKERVVWMSHNSGMRSHSPDPESRRRGGNDLNMASGSASSHSSGETAGLTVGSDDETKRKAFDPAEMFQKDWRTYVCKTWHLEPTVRLLSWAGKSIEPYGVDYILQKLGFSHARTTIPKWMQRGFMDPLDKVLSMLVIRMVSVARGGDGRDDEGEDGSGNKTSVDRVSVVSLRQKKGLRPKEKSSSVHGKVK